MIKLCENLNVLKLLPQCYETVKISSLANCYGLNTSFLYLYKQTGKNGKLLAVILRFGNEATVYAVSKVNKKELREFLTAFGLNVTASKKLAKQLGFKKYAVYNCLVFKGKGKQCNNNPLGYESVYNILASAKSNSIVLPEYNSWYVDFCHRIRHNSARVFSVNKQSVALTGFETVNGAVVSGVATTPEYCCRGYASQNVLGLCRELTAERKKVFLLCNNTVLKFYKKLGFVKQGKIAIINNEEN